MPYIFLILRIAEVLIFLGILYGIVRLLLHRGFTGADSRPATLTLVKGHGQSVLVEGGEGVIGRRPDALIPTDRSNRYISARHAVISYSNDPLLVRSGWFLKQLGSQEVLLVNGTPVPPDKKARLGDGDMITLPDGRQWQFNSPDLRGHPRPPLHPTSRVAEGMLLAATSLFLVLGLLTADIGLHLYVPDTRMQLGWLMLWVGFSLGWLVIWLLLSWADIRQQRNHYRRWQVRTSFPHQAILPLVALLISIGLIVGYRGEAVALSPSHEAALQEQFELTLQSEQQAKPITYVVDFWGAMDLINPNWLTVRMADGDTLKMLFASMAGVMLAVTMRLVASEFPLKAIPDWVRSEPARVDRVNRWRTRLLQSRLGRLLVLRIRWWLLAAGPLGVLVVSAVLKVLGWTGRIEPVNGQLLPWQISEFVRLFVLLYMIGLISARLNNFIKRWVISVALFGMGIGLACYYLATNDLGPLLVCGLFMVSLCFLLLRAMYVLLAYVTLIVSMVILVNSVNPTRMAQSISYAQITAWYERPAAYLTDDEYRHNCQEGTVPERYLCQADSSLRLAQYAMASGGVFGTGPGQGVTIPPLGALSNVYVANIHSDYVFVEIVEEYGIVGGMLTLAVLFVLSLYAFRLSQTLDRPLARTTAAACGLWWSIHTLLIVGGSTRMLPLMGIPLPFISDGNAARLVNGVILGLLLVAGIGARASTLDLARRPQLSFATIRLMVTFAYCGVLVWITVGMYVVDRFLYTDTQEARSAVPGSAAYTRLQQLRAMGTRMQCIHRSRPRHNVLTADGQVLIAQVPIIDGCNRYDTVDISGAQLIAFDAVLDDVMGSNKEFAERLANDDVELTIDGERQQAVVDLLVGGLGDQGILPWGQAIVMRRDGSIIALADLTANQPDLLENDGSLVFDRNPLSQSFYVPGSVFKVVTTLAALRAGMTTEDAIPCYSGQMIEGRPQPVSNSFGDLNCVVAGPMTSLTGALAYSINTFFSGLTDAAPPNELPLHAQLPLSREQVIDAATSLGMRELTEDGRVPRAPYWNFSLPIVASPVSGVSKLEAEEFNAVGWRWADTTYGQGTVKITPVQLAVMMQIIANDGVAATPRLIEDAWAPGWEEEQQISEEEARALRQLLNDTVTIPMGQPVFDGVENWSLAGAAHVVIDGRQLVAGKTGTAEVDKRPEMHWFAGFAPSDDPEYIVVVMLSQEVQVDPAQAGQCSPAAIAGTIFDMLLDAPEPLGCRERGR